MRIISLITYIVLLTSCESGRPVSVKKETVSDRAGRPIYQVQVPKGWKHANAMPDEDTTIANSTFYVGDDLRITIHNFPQDRRIPPAAQIARWKQQNDESFVTPVSWGGYAGLFFEAPAVLGWALTLAPHHYRALEDRQQRADVTIKATGSPESIVQYKEAITTFAHSFELIEEIPLR